MSLVDFAHSAGYLRKLCVFWCVLSSFLYYQMPQPDKTPVNAVSFTTGWGSQGDWIVYETDGKCPSMQFPIVWSTSSVRGVCYVMMSALSVRINYDYYEAQTTLNISD